MTEIMPTTATDQPVPVTPGRWSLQTLMRFARTISETDFVPASLRGNAPAVLAAIMTGREMGIGPMESLSEIAVINGRPTCSARLMRKLVMRAGHRIEVEELTEKECRLLGTRSDGVSMRVSWTIEDAMRAGLVGAYEAWETTETGRKRRKVWSPAWGPEPPWVAERGKPIVSEAWQRYPRAMLLARATTELVRCLFPDCLGSVAMEPEELGADPHPADLEVEEP